MPPILVVWEHGGGMGHLVRLLPVMDALRERGWPVVFAAAQPHKVAPLLAGTGVTVLQAPQVDLALYYATSAVCPADIWLRCGFASPPHAAVCVRQWLALFEGLMPAAVLADASPLALYAAQMAGLPAVALGNGFALPPPLPGLSFAPWQGDLASSIAHSERVLESAQMGLAAGMARDCPSVKDLSSGVCRANSIGAMLSLSAQALCTWPELDHFDRAADAAGYVGPIWTDLPGGQAVAWPDKPGAKVICYLTLNDTRHDFMWQALQQHGANVVVVSPGGIEGVCELARGWGITVCRHAVAMTGLLQDCDAVIGHGGGGLTSMALLGGKPLMVLPTQLEQGLMAYRLTQRGLAISSLSPLNKTQVQARVAQLLQDAALQARVTALAQRYAGYLPQQAVDRVVAMLLNGAGQNTDPNASLNNPANTAVSAPNEPERVTCSLL